MNIPYPAPVPGAKIGIANIVSLLALILFGFKAGLTVAVMRSFLAITLAGAPTSLLFSLSGSIASVVIMSIAYYYGKDFFSIVGISILGAQTHNIAQLFVASLILNSFSIFLYLPVLMIIALITGYFTGVTTKAAKKLLVENFQNIKTRGC